MKNKKLITRLFALLASFVLVFALALPCFADVRTSFEESIPDDMKCSALNVFYQFIDSFISGAPDSMVTYEQIMGSFSTISSGNISFGSHFVCKVDFTNSDFSFVQTDFLFIISFPDVPNGMSDNGVSGAMFSERVLYRFNISSLKANVVVAGVAGDSAIFNYDLTVSDAGSGKEIYASLSSLQYISPDNIITTFNSDSGVSACAAFSLGNEQMQQSYSRLLFNNQYSVSPKNFIQGYNMALDESSTDTPTEPEDGSSLYSQLFDILKDAIYGSDVELTGPMEYALTLISTILTYATILLPVILVIFIAVWCFKRF